MQFVSTAAQENGSEKQLKVDKDVFSQPPSSIFFFEKGLCHALEEHDGKVSTGDRTIIICGLLMTLMLLLNNSKN